MDLVEYHRLATEIHDGVTEHKKAEADPVRGWKTRQVTERWVRKMELGHGGFSTVWLEKNQLGALRAVKVIRKDFTRHHGVDYLRELSAMAFFSRDRPRFPEFYGWFDDGPHICIAMEYFPLGDLAKCVQEPVTEVEAQTICWQISDAMSLLHARNMTHRDIKPQVKLGDFGISKHIDPEHSGLRTQIFGSFVAPEATDIMTLNNISDDEDEDGSTSHYTNAVDIWSFGCILFWLLSLKCPFKSARAMARYCKAKTSLPMDVLSSTDLSPACIDVVSSCLSPDPNSRPTATQLLDSNWLEVLSTEEDNLSLNLNSFLPTSFRISSLRQASITGVPRPVGSETQPSNVPKPLQVHIWPKHQESSKLSYPATGADPGRQDHITYQHEPQIVENVSVKRGPAKEISDLEVGTASLQVDNKHPSSTTFADNFREAEDARQPEVPTSSAVVVEAEQSSPKVDHEAKPADTEIDTSRPFRSASDRLHSKRDTRRTHLSTKRSKGDDVDTSMVELQRRESVEEKAPLAEGIARQLSRKWMSEDLQNVSEMKRERSRNPISGGRRETKTEKVDDKAFSVMSEGDDISGGDSTATQLLTNASNESIQTRISSFQNSLGEDPMSIWLAQSTWNPLSSADIAVVFLQHLDRECEAKHLRPVSNALLPFLQTMFWVCEIFDKLCLGSAQTPGQIWACVKVTLLLAAKTNSILGKVCRLMVDINDLNPHLVEYRLLINSSVALQVAFCDYIATIIRFCERVVIFVQKSGSALLYDIKTMLRPFDVEVSQDREAVKKASQVMQEQVSLAARISHEQSRREIRKSKSKRLENDQLSRAKTKGSRQSKKLSRDHSGNAGEEPKNVKAEPNLPLAEADHQEQNESTTTSEKRREIARHGQTTQRISEVSSAADRKNVANVEVDATETTKQDMTADESHAQRWSSKFFGRLKEYGKNVHT